MCLLEAHNVLGLRTGSMESTGWCACAPVYVCTHVSRRQETSPGGALAPDWGTGGWGLGPQGEIRKGGEQGAGESNGGEGRRGQRWHVGGE